MASMTNPVTKAPPVYAEQPRTIEGRADFWPILPDTPTFIDVFDSADARASRFDRRGPPGIVKYRYDAPTQQAVFSVQRPFYDWSTGTSRLLAPIELKVDYVLTEQSITATAQQKCAITYLHNIPGTYEHIFCCLIGGHKFQAWGVYRKEDDPNPQKTLADLATFAPLVGAEVGSGWRVSYHNRMHDGEGDYQLDIIRDGQKLRVQDFKTHCASYIWRDKVTEYEKAHNKTSAGPCPLTESEYNDLQVWWRHLMPEGIKNAMTWINKKEKRYLLPLVANDCRMRYSEWLATQHFAAPAAAIAPA